MASPPASGARQLDVASRFWSCLLLAQLTAAAGLTLALSRALALSPVAILLTAALTCAALPCLLVTAGFVVSGTARRALAAGWSGPRELLEALLRECLAFSWAMLVTILEPYRRRRRPADAPAAGRARPVLLIHGIVCNRSIWGPLIARLEARGYAPLRALNLEPLFADLELHAATVARELRELQQQCAGAPVTVVTHSMGGLVARAALRALGPSVVKRIVTLAAPHHGTRMARLLPSPAARQMSPGSAWLGALNATQEGHLPVPLISIYSLHDSLIAPPESSILGGARLQALRGLGHLSLLCSARSLNGTLAALLENG